MTKPLISAIFAAFLAVSAQAIEGWRISPFEATVWKTLARESGPAASSPVAVASAVCMLGEAGNSEMRGAMAGKLKLMSDFAGTFEQISDA